MKLLRHPYTPHPYLARYPKSPLEFLYLHLKITSHVKSKSTGGTRRPLQTTNVVTFTPPISSPTSNRCHILHSATIASSLVLYHYGARLWSSTDHNHPLCLPSSFLSDLNTSSSNLHLHHLRLPLPRVSFWLLSLPRVSSQIIEPSLASNVIKSMYF